MMNKQKNLHALFKPNSIAVLGASRDEKKIGHIVLRNILESGFEGKIFAVNPNAQSVLDIECFSDYVSLPETPDLAVVALPAAVAVSLLESIAQKGTKNIVMFSAGFKEAGLAGAALEADLQAAAKKYDLNILGPNCLGFASTLCNVNATFSQAENRAGNLRFMSQSGALASGIFDWAKQQQIGFSEFITLGNKAVIHENDILEYWLNQKTKNNTEVGLSNYQPIGMYLESISEGAYFLELAKKIAKQHPIFILKPGHSKHAQQAIQSHTGSMAGDDKVQRTAFAEAGILYCEGVEDMFDMAKIFSWENAPRGPRVAIVSNAGGPAVLSTDALEKEGLQLAVLSKKTIAKLEENLPRAANVLNPVDVLGDALSARYHEAIEDVLAEKTVDALLVIVTPQIMTEIEDTAELIGTLSAKYAKPVVCSFMGGSAIEAGEHVLNKYKIPSFRFPERAVKALSVMWHWQQRRHTLSIENTKYTLGLFAKSKIHKIEKIIQTVKTENKVLSLIEAEDVLKVCGIKTPPSEAVRTMSEAWQFGQKHGLPFVLKVSSPMLIHKTEAQAVFTNIYTEADLKKIWARIVATVKKLPKNSDYVVQAQKQIESGLELIAGIKNDANFGNVMMFGAGGILAELIGDSNLVIAPITEKNCVSLLEKSKAFTLLRGFRGHKPYAIKKLVSMLIKFGWLAEAVPYFNEMTINPIIVTATEAWAVDPRFILKQK